jgi:vancomycin resistance protein YoaR
MPTPPTPEPAAPVQPAPTPPEPSVQVTPTRTAPLLITVRAEWPALIDGKKTTLPFTRTLTVSGARVAQLRGRGGGISASLEADLKKFVSELPSKPEDARFEELWDGWSVVQRNGLIINMEKTRASIEAVLKNPQGVQASVIVSGQVAPERTLNFFASRGITQHLSTGETNYYGSSAARITNIHVGASRFKDRLIEGKVFSFNGAVGAINTKNGFVTGLVISGERTADGVGGGICQVSTTVFRALYGAGLSTLQRQPHSYQVHYYDPQGLDATIYQPSLDLKFANDTGGALWFQTDWNDDEARLTVAVFGQARDYTVEVGAPRTLATRPSPADRLISDPTLPAGQRKQVDWAAPGATLEVTRKFVRNGQAFKQDILRSVYRPWPNIFLVGTRR